MKLGKQITLIDAAYEGASFHRKRGAGAPLPLLHPSGGPYFMATGFGVEEVLTGSTG